MIIAAFENVVQSTDARIYENVLSCLMLRGLLFNSIQKFRENNAQLKK